MLKGKYHVFLHSSKCLYHAPNRLSEHHTKSMVFAVRPTVRIQANIPNTSTEAAEARPIPAHNEQTELSTKLPVTWITKSHDKRAYAVEKVTPRKFITRYTVVKVSETVFEVQLPRCDWQLGRWMVCNVVYSKLKIWLLITFRSNCTPTSPTCYRTNFWNLGLKTLVGHWP